jgi:TonB C terminal
VHPYFSQVGKALMKNWDADRVAASGLKGLTEQMGKNVQLMNEIWLSNAQKFGASGSVGEVTGTTRRSVVSNSVSGTVGLDFEARREGAKAIRDQFKATRRATIKVVQDTTGVVKSIELLSPSNDATVDREAVKDISDKARALPVPPPEAIGNKTELVSIWSFELIVSISPPVPTFTFEFDEALGYIDARLPLDRRIYKRVRLMSVE